MLKKLISRGFFNLGLTFAMGIVLSVNSLSVRADEVYTFVLKKQEEKAKTRWSLSDWLETRDKMRLQDLWLALHSPSPYEVYVAADALFLNHATLGPQQAWHAQVASYASIFGLEGNYLSGPVQDFSALFKLRIFGFNVQATNLTLEAGVRQKGTVDAFRNPVLGAHATLYLAKFFGLDGGYQYYLGSTPRANGISSTGYRWDAGAFVDFNFVRVYGSYLSEYEDSAFLQNGANLGIKLFF
jgi:hypothetical protein